MILQNRSCSSKLICYSVIYSVQTPIYTDGSVTTVRSACSVIMPLSMELKPTRLTSSTAEDLTTIRSAAGDIVGSTSAGAADRLARQRAVRVYITLYRTDNARAGRILTREINFLNGLSMTSPVHVPVP